MNSHKFNMYAGSIIGSVLFFLLLGFFSELIYVGRGHSEHEVLAYAVEIEEADAASESTGGGAEAAVDWAALVQGADAANGEKIFGKCKACHKVEEGANGVGPSLWGVVGRKIASIDGFKYSDTLTGIDGNWDLEHLLAFLEAPKAYAPGTKMTFAGLSNIDDRIDLIAYLNEADGTPMDMVPAGETAASASGASAAEAVTEAVTAATEAATEAATAATESVTEAVTETVTAATEAVAAAAGGDDYASLLASADAAAGEKVFSKCKACHKVEEGKHGLGPSLWGVVGRDIGSAEGYKYSDPVMATEGNWTGANLFAYLADPKGFIPGNKMSFPGLKKAQDRVNVITYLNEADGSPEPLQ